MNIEVFSISIIFSFSELEKLVDIRIITMSDEIFKHTRGFQLIQQMALQSLNLSYCQAYGLWMYHLFIAIPKERATVFY